MIFQIMNNSVVWQQFYEFRQLNHEKLIKEDMKHIWADNYLRFIWSDCSAIPIVTLSKNLAVLVTVTSDLSASCYQAISYISLFEEFYKTLGQSNKEGVNCPLKLLNK